VTAANAGVSFSTAALAPGSHTISAKAYDNATTDLVRPSNGQVPDSVKNNYCHRPLAALHPDGHLTVTKT